MKRKNGFISMSLIYSFFIVFVAISISLLAIYSSNINLVKNVNKEIKNDLTDKGNKNLVVLTNLIKDGSFEDYPSQWTYTGNTARIDSIQKYYGTKSLYTDGSANYVTSNYNINMVNGHYYYFQRIYQAPVGTEGYATDSEAPAEVLINDQAIIKRKTARPCTGWNHIVPTTAINTDNCGNSRSMERTVEVFAFEYRGTTGNYPLKIRSNNRYMYTDGYILVDLTASIGQEKINNIQNAERINRLTNAIEKVIDSTYFEGRKVFTIYQTGL